MIEFQGVSKVYGQGDVRVHALRDVSFRIEPGERVILMGPSGSGKSTLLHIAAGLDRPTAGEVLIDGERIGELDSRAQALLRRHRVGFVFQFFNVLPSLTAIENVCLPLDLSGVERREAEGRALALLERVGVAKLRDRFPEQLSGGEMQRVAVARALARGPDVVLADEPTGNLDSVTGQEVLSVLAEMVGSERTLLVATHDPSARRIGTRLFFIKDGSIAQESSL